MNAKPIILLLAIVSVGGMGITSQAFGSGYGDGEVPYRYLDTDRDNLGNSEGLDESIKEHTPIYFETDGDTYDHNSVISINGWVNQLRGTDVTVVVSGPMILVPTKPLPDGTLLDEIDVYAPMNIVQIDQVQVSSDGSFLATVDTSSPMMKYDGEYKIKVTYFQEVNYFDYVNLVDGVGVESMAGHEEHHEEVFDLASAIDYSISGGHVEGVTANVNGNSLVVAIHDAEDGGELTITLPSDVITPFNDGTFFVLVNDEESDDASQDGNTITVPFDADATTVEIIGTHVVPEFGTIAAIILAVAITSIIVLSAKTRLSIMPKL